MERHPFDMGVDSEEEILQEKGYRRDRIKSGIYLTVIAFRRVGVQTMTGSLHSIRATQTSKGELGYAPRPTDRRLLVRACRLDSRLANVPPAEFGSSRV